MDDYYADVLHMYVHMHAICVCMYVCVYLPLQWIRCEA